MDTPNLLCPDVLLIMHYLSCSLITQSPGDVLNNAITFFRDALRNASTPQDAWDTLMQYDQYTTREALMT
jgi:hypothetical protein